MERAGVIIRPRPMIINSTPARISPRNAFSYSFMVNPAACAVLTIWAHGRSE
jgi:hypothetical protein